MPVAGGSRVRLTPAARVAGRSRRCLSLMWWGTPGYAGRRTFSFLPVALPTLAALLQFFADWRLPAPLVAAGCRFHAVFLPFDRPGLSFWSPGFRALLTLAHFFRPIFCRLLLPPSTFPSLYIWLSAQLYANWLKRPSTAVFHWLFSLAGACLVLCRRCPDDHENPLNLF